jgi:cyanophycinase-like exopeptidase
MNRRAVLPLLIVILVLSSSNVSAQVNTTPLLVPFGGGIAGDLLPGDGDPPATSVTRAEYTRFFTGLAPAALERTVDGEVKVLVLPIALSTNPESITAAQKTDLLRVAESRFFHISEACQNAMPVGTTCQASLAPIYVRTDALDPVMLDYFAQDWSIIFILSGDPSTAMRVIQGTPVEAALGMLYREGVIISGTGASANILSIAVLEGYQGKGQNPPITRAGARIWDGELRHGLSFGVQDVLLETQFYQLGRLGGLLQAISNPDAPHLGIGLDAYTGVHIRDGHRLEDVFGLYTTTILDAETYRAAESAIYRDCPAGSPCAPVLSIRNVLVHLLAPGPFTYNLSNKQHSLGAPAPLSARDFSSLAIPQGAGPLILAGDLSKNLNDNPILAHFGELSGGKDGRVLVITAGFPSDSSTERMANWIASDLEGMPVKLILWKNATTMPSFPKYYTGIIFSVGNQSRLKPELLEPIKEAWLAGMPLLADNGAASAMGAYFSFHGPTPAEGKPAEIATQASFLKGETQLHPGLGLLDINIEPQVLEDNRWGRLFSLAYNHPFQLAVGICRDTALEIDHQGARVIGSNGIFVIDFRGARLDVGDNRGFVVANGLLDVYAPGEELWEAPSPVIIPSEFEQLAENDGAFAEREATHPVGVGGPDIGSSTETIPDRDVVNQWLGIGSLAALAVLILLFGILIVKRRQS